MFRFNLAKPSFLSVLSVLLLVFSDTVYAMLPVIDFAALAQLGNQLAELRVQTQSIQQALQTLSGDQYQWSQAQGLLNQLGDIMQKTHGITTNAARMDDAFKQAYPGYQAPANFSEQYRNNVNTAQNTFNGVLQGIGLTAQHFQDENTRLAFLQRQSQSAQGQTQAIQASSQISSELVSQLQLLRQTVMAQSNAQTAYYATQVQQEASSRAELEAILRAGSTDVPAYGSSGNTLEAPEF
jgi:type IV secretion system protein TrbJ